MYEFKWRHYDASIGIFVTVDPKAEDYNYQSTYTYAVNNPIYFVIRKGESPEAYPIERITKQKTGKTAIQRVLGYSGGKTTQVDLYKVVVTDTEDSSFRMEFSVTREAWTVEKGNSVASNVAFELKDGKVMKGGYPRGNGTEALKLTQKGSEEANETSVKMDIEIRKMWQLM